MKFKLFKIRNRLLEFEFHFHKYTTLLIYPPILENNSSKYGFLLKCDCGYTKFANMPDTITEYFVVVGNKVEEGAL